MTEPKEMPTEEQAHTALKDMTDALERLGVNYHLDGGTLLGFYRQGNFCEDDHDDIDLTVYWFDWVRVQEIIEEAKKLGFEVYKEWPRDTERHRSGQLAFKRDNVKVDLMFKEKLSDRIYWCVYGGPNGVTYKAVPAELLCETYLPPHGYREPKNAYDYLTYRYGDWQEPVHRSEYSCYTSDKSIVESYESITAK